MKNKLAKLACDGAAVVGMAAFDYGLWLAWHPLGFIVGGLAVGAGAFFLGYGTTRKAR